MSRWAAVLAGGSGTRFWPLSTNRTPKQLLPLAGPEPLLVQTVKRLGGLIPPERILVITSTQLRGVTGKLLPEIPDDNLLGEPRAASTGPALAWATQVVAAREPDASVLALHADWFVDDEAAFRTTGRRALEVAERYDVLVSVGMVPTRPEIGYGYIQPGEVLEGEVCRVERFVEKPSIDRAAALIRSGALWNSGLFAWTARRFFAETESLVPEIAPHLARLRRGDVDGYFQSVTPIAVDVSHFERSRRVAVVSGGFAWDDVGTWGALSRIRTPDEAANVLVDDAVAVDSSGSVVWAGDGPVVLFGVRDLVVVRANGVVLVTTQERAARLKDLLPSLPPRLRDVGA